MSKEIKGRECYFTVEKLIEELNKIEDKNLLVLDSANDFLEEVCVREYLTATYVQLM